LVYHRPPKGQRVGKEIDAAFIFARADFVNVLRSSHHDGQRLPPAIG
jgi:hypothetical protein